MTPQKIPQSQPYEHVDASHPELGIRGDQKFELHPSMFLEMFFDIARLTK